MTSRIGLPEFLKAVRADPTLQARLRNAADANAVVAIAGEAGFRIAVAELNEARGTLSDEELESVAGGAQFWWQVDPGTWKTLVTDGLPD